MKKIISSATSPRCWRWAASRLRAARSSRPDGADQPGQSGGADHAGLQSGDAETIKIGLLAPLTGEVAEYGVAVANGVRLYVQGVQRRGRHERHAHRAGRV